MNQQQKKLALARITLIMNNHLIKIKKDERDFINENPKLRTHTIADIQKFILDGTLPFRTYDVDNIVDAKRLKDTASSSSDLGTFYDFDDFNETKEIEGRKFGMIPNPGYGSRFVTTKITLINPLEKYNHHFCYQEYMVPAFLERAEIVLKEYSETIDIVTFGADSDILDTIKKLQNNIY